MRVGYGCNNRCTFCHTRGLEPDAADPGLVEAKIRRARQLAHTQVVLSGGEPTIRPDLARWVRCVQDCGVGLGLVTNGRMLAYPWLTDRLVHAGLAYAHVSLHGGSPNVHDAIVRAPAFEQTWRGVCNLRARAVDVTLACVITQANLARLREFVDRVATLGDVEAKFAFPEPKGEAAREFDTVVPSLVEVGEAVLDALRYARAAAPSVRLTHEGIPLCLVPDFESAAVGLRSHQFVSASEVGEADFFSIDSRNHHHPEACRDCGFRGRCPGVFRSYFERRQDFEPRPEHHPRSNSYSYRSVRELRWPSGRPCPIHEDGVTPYDRARCLFVVQGERMRQFETMTCDFSDGEIEHSKCTAGQVYLDVGQAAASRDFPADFRKLERHDRCRACPEAERCAGSYVEASGDVFRRDDAWLRTRLRRLAGDVLEIGCGEGRYLDELAPGAESGRLRYRGVDPDTVALGRLRRCWPWAETRAESAEQLELEPQSVDHVLLLHSYNHLRHLELVAKRVAAALRLGGTLLVADDVAFGLVRSAGQLRRAESGPARFEHYRNDGAREAVACFETLGLRLIEQREVGPDTSSQWVVHLRREGARI